MSVKRKKHELGGEPASDADASAEVAGPMGSEAASPEENASDGPEAAPPGEPAAEPSGNGGKPSGEDELLALAARVAALEVELAASRDQLLRKAADFDNYRKRIAREKEESIRFANGALVTDIIESMDGLERAIASTERSQDFTALHQGVVLIEKQLLDVLGRKWGLERMSAAGGVFDPARHQAVVVGEAVESGEQVVLEEYESGYLLHERVLRPAKVRVSAPRARPAGPPAAAADGQVGTSG